MSVESKVGKRRLEINTFYSFWKDCFRKYRELLEWYGYEGVVFVYLFGVGKGERESQLS